jgi:hypothetical protein
VRRRGRVTSVAAVTGAGPANARSDPDIGRDVVEQLGDLLADVAEARSRTARAFGGPRLADVPGEVVGDLRTALALVPRRLRLRLAGRRLRRRLRGFRQGLGLGGRAVRRPRAARRGASSAAPAGASTDRPCARPLEGLPLVGPRKPRLGARSGARRALAEAAGAARRSAQKALRRATPRTGPRAERLGKGGRGRRLPDRERPRRVRRAWPPEPIRVRHAQAPRRPLRRNRREAPNDGVALRDAASKAGLHACPIADPFDAEAQPPWTRASTDWSRFHRAHATATHASRNRW